MRMITPHRTSIRAVILSFRRKCSTLRVVTFSRCRTLYKQDSKNSSTQAKGIPKQTQDSSINAATHSLSKNTVIWIISRKKESFKRGKNGMKWKDKWHCLISRLRCLKSRFKRTHRGRRHWRISISRCWMRLWLICSTFRLRRTRCNRSYGLRTFKFNRQNNQQTIIKLSSKKRSKPWPPSKIEIAN